MRTPQGSGYVVISSNGAAAFNNATGWVQTAPALPGGGTGTGTGTGTGSGTAPPGTPVGHPARSPRS